MTVLGIALEHRRCMARAADGASAALERGAAQVTGTARLRDVAREAGEAQVTSAGPETDVGEETAAAQARAVTQETVVAQAAVGPGAAGADPRHAAALERAWSRLDAELRLLDQLLPGPEDGGAGSATPVETPPAPPPLALPTAAQLSDQQVQVLSLEQAVVIALAESPQVQARRLEVAAALAQLQSRLGTYWPRIAAVGGLGYDQTVTRFGVPAGNGSLALGPNFAAAGLRAADGSTTDGPFFVPSGATATLNQGVRQLSGGLELDLAVLDFARSPTIQAARARLRQARAAYANSLRHRQLEVSEAYYGLQRADQLVRIREADLRNDGVILEEVLALKQAGLVPRLDLLRRQAFEAESEEQLIQARADQAVARRRLAVLLNLPANLTPRAADPIRIQSRWPFGLEESLLAAYRDNPELALVLASRDALAQDRQALAAQLLPRLSLFAAAAAGSSQTQQWNISGDCCGTTAIPIQNSAGTDWSVGLAFRWLLFDGGSTAAALRSLTQQEQAEAQRYAASRNDIRLRLEQAFFEHGASLGKLASSQRGVRASLEAFRDARLRYQSGLANEVTLSLTQDRLITSLVQRLEATVAVNITYARLLRELLPMPTDTAVAVPVQLTLPEAGHQKPVP